jgi:hypothetical protein
MEATFSSGTSVDFQRITRHYIPEARILYNFNEFFSTTHYKFISQQLVFMNAVSIFLRAKNSSWKVLSWDHLEKFRELQRKHRNDLWKAISSYVSSHDTGVLMCAYSRKSSTLGRNLGTILWRKLFPHREYLKANVSMGARGSVVG